VRSGSKGRIQIGSDFSTKERDIGGNVIDKFYSTGTILEVTPKAYKYGANDFIDLPYHAERSSVAPGAVSTIVNKSTSDGRITVLNGEEAFVAGLYSSEETIVREGVPILKDLPWWVLGLRYIFGYDSHTNATKELIILLKAELVPTIEERIKELAKEHNVIQEKLKDYRDDLTKKLKKD